LWVLFWVRNLSFSPRPKKKKKPTFDKDAQSPLKHNWWFFYSAIPQSCWFLLGAVPVSSNCGGTHQFVQGLVVSLPHPRAGSLWLLSWMPHLHVNWTCLPSSKP
jgi:hypothetical protein